MPGKRFILAIDQGTSGTKTIVIDDKAKVHAKATEPLKTSYLNNGFVEQDPEEIYRNVLSSVEKCLKDFAHIDSIVTCGISNQRETFVVWDKDGKPLHNAVVWQCKRSIAICEKLKVRGLEVIVGRKTGLLIDPYFSGTKLIWLHENNTAVRNAIDKGEAYFGTVDTWLLYRLTNGRSYYTDYTNASRTLFFNLSTLSWDKELLATFGLSKLKLPECRPSSAFFGRTDFGGLFEQNVDITSMIGDSHAAAFGEGCYLPGTAKATLGTGCSILMNVGTQLKYSDSGMISTICWSTEHTVQFALEGVIVTAGATIEWLKNELGLINDGKDTEAMALSVEDNNGVYVVPAFSGLGAPHWDMSRKASIVGLTFNANKNHIVRAALESIPYQINDIIVAMEEDTTLKLKQLMVDGGMTSNSFVVQFLADLLQIKVANIGMADVSALGAAYLAGLKSGVFENIEALTRLNPDIKVYQPKANHRMNAYCLGWQKAVKLNK
ncbi:MAG TPA: glycerol kinase GlpK [Cyclobacteriaceae bacterium]|nr:glycerol kinase GlpK [Cyclobacteriaceae bacterium]